MAEPERFTRDALELARDLCRAAAGPFDFDEGLGWPRRDARSVREARMWVRQQRCVCGANRFEPTEKLDPPESAEPAARLDIEGDCPVCGDRRLYQFTVPDRPARRPSGPMGYGLHYEDDRPSVLFDPGQFLALGLLYGRFADQAVADQPADIRRVGSRCRSPPSVGGAAVTCPGMAEVAAVTTDGWGVGAGIGGIAVSTWVASPDVSASRCSTLNGRGWLVSCSRRRCYGSPCPAARRGG